MPSADDTRAPSPGAQPDPAGLQPPTRIGRLVAGGAARLTVTGLALVLIGMAAGLPVLVAVVAIGPIVGGLAVLAVAFVRGALAERSEDRS